MHGTRGRCGQFRPFPAVHRQAVHAVVHHHTVLLGDEDAVLAIPFVVEHGERRGDAAVRPHREPAHVLAVPVDEVEAFRRGEEQLQFSVLEPVHLLHLAQDAAFQRPAPQHFARGAHQVQAVQVILHQHFMRSVRVVHHDLRRS